MHRGNDTIRKQFACAIVGLFFLSLSPVTATAHVFVGTQWRQGTNPKYPGNGWIAKVYLNIPVPPPPTGPNRPDEGTLTFAENYVADKTPDFTFQTDWIDYPSGPEPIGHDADYQTIGEFLAGNVRNVSDPAKLDEPFGSFLIQFSGFLKVTFEDDTTELGLPVWVDFGTFGYDGYRLVVGETIYRWPLVPVEDFFWRENPICQAVGLYPISITFFNRYDPNNEIGFGDVGIEVYTWHGSERAWPTGQRMVNATRGQGSIIPPRVIYQIQDVSPVQFGDFNADGTVDVGDARWFQHCFSGPSIDGEFLSLRPGCTAFDFDNDRDIDLVDFIFFNSFMTGPN